MSQVTEQAIVTSQSAVKPGQVTTKLALFNVDGTPYSASAALQADTQIQALTLTASPNATQAAGANPTKAEYDVVVALVNELKGDLNALINALKA